VCKIRKHIIISTTRYIIICIVKKKFDFCDREFIDKTNSDFIVSRRGKVGKQYNGRISQSIYSTFSDRRADGYLSYISIHRT